MDPKRVQEASYRGAPFLLSSSTLGGGRKDVLKSFPNSDRQLIEDLGLRQPTFEMSGVISARPSLGLDYEDVRDRLIAALEKGGPGILVHPFFGPLKNIVCRTFSLTEDMTRLGDSPIRISFAVSNADDGLPVQSTDTLTSISQLRIAVSDAAKKDIEDNYDADPKFLGNFQAAKDKVSDFFDDVREASDPVVAVIDQIDEFTNTIIGFQTDVAKLTNAPTDLADSLIRSYDSINGLYPTAKATLRVFVNFFTFGQADDVFSLTTAGRIQRQKNNDVLNVSIQSMALSYGYLNAAQVEFETVDSIEETQGILEDQFQILYDSEINRDTLDALFDIRKVTDDLLEAEKLNARKVITVRTNPTSTRLLAYRYYGSSELGDKIAELNEFNDSFGISGNVKIFTK